MFCRPHKILTLSKLTFPFVLQLMLIIGLAHALVVFRVVAAPLMYRGEWTFIKDHARTAAVTLGAVLHYFTIQIMTRVRVSLQSTCLVNLLCVQSGFGVRPLVTYITYIKCRDNFFKVIF